MWRAEWLRVPARRRGPRGTVATAMGALDRRGPVLLRRLVLSRAVRWRWRRVGLLLVRAARLLPPPLHLCRWPVR